MLLEVLPSIARNEYKSFKAPRHIDISGSQTVGLYEESD